MSNYYEEYLRFVEDRDSCTFEQWLVKELYLKDVELQELRVQLDYFLELSKKGN